MLYFYFPLMVRLLESGFDSSYHDPRKFAYFEYIIGCHHPHSASRRGFLQLREVGYEAISLQRHCHGLHFERRDSIPNIHEEIAAAEGKRASRYDFLGRLATVPSSR